MKAALTALALLTLTACAGEANDSKAAGLPGSPVLRGEDFGPANGSCADAAAELTYDAFRYQGGAAPGPMITVASRKLVFKGETLGETATKGDGSQQGEWNVTLTFDAASKVTLEKTGTPQAGSETYAQKLKVAKGDLAVERFVICSNGWNYLLP